MMFTRALFPKLASQLSTYFRVCQITFLVENKRVILLIVICKKNSSFIENDASA